jgi:hypothetical protein
MALTGHAVTHFLHSERVHKDFVKGESGCTVVFVTTDTNISRVPWLGLISNVLIPISPWPTNTATCL